MSVCRSIRKPCVCNRKEHDDLRRIMDATTQRVDYYYYIYLFLMYTDPQSDQQGVKRNIARENNVRNEKKKKKFNMKFEFFDLVFYF